MFKIADEFLIQIEEIRDINGEPEKRYKFKDLDIELTETELSKLEKIGNKNEFIARRRI